mgnify:CR=1 FL=1
MKQTAIPAGRWNADVACELPAEAVQRLESAQLEMESLLSMQRQTLEQSRAHTDAMHQRLMQLQAQLDTMTATNQPLDRVFIGISFNHDGGSGTLYRDPFSGSLCLNPTGFEPLNQMIDGVWIDRENSVGIPGNNMVISSINQTGGGLPEVKLVSETDAHANILLAFDSSLDTWFEWERNMVIPNQRLNLIEGCMYISDSSGNELNVQQITSGHGWTVSVFYPGIEQPVKNVPLADFKSEPSSSDTPARLALEISFSEVIRGAWFECVPYHIGGRSTLVEKVSVSEDGVNWREMAAPVKLPVDRGDERPFRIYLNNVKYMRIWFKSGGWYMPRQGLGHLFAAAFIKETRKSSLFGFIPLPSSTSRWVERLPTEEASVGTIAVYEDGTVKLASRVIGGAIGLATGIAMKVMTQVIGQSAVAALGGFAGPVAFVLGALIFGGLISTKITREVERTVHGIDVFKGWRSALGIREMRVVRRTYQSGGEWVSPVYTLRRPVRQLQVWAHDDIPDGTEIRYQIRVNDGDWMDVDVHGANTVSLEDQAHKVQVRVLMSSTAGHVTPVTYSIMVEGY